MAKGIFASYIFTVYFLHKCTGYLVFILYNRQNQKYSFSKRKVQKIEGLETSV